MEIKNLGKANTLKTIKINNKNYQIYSLKSLYDKHPNLARIPFSLKILLENILRNFDGKKVKEKDIEFFTNWDSNNNIKHEISYYPARILMQDFTGVPAIVDLASMRDSANESGLDPNIINPNKPVLVIECAHPNSWYKILNRSDKVIGIETFGESAPGSELLEHFGFNKDNVIQKAKSLIND